jgi:hypothetical protein
LALEGRTGVPWQIGLVREALNSSPAGAWRLLVTHRPVLPQSLSGLVGRGPLVEACAGAGLSVLLSGHIHVPRWKASRWKRRVRCQARAVGAGTAMSRRPRGAPNAFTELELARPPVTGTTPRVGTIQSDGNGWLVTRSERFESDPEASSRARPRGSEVAQRSSRPRLRSLGLTEFRHDGVNVPDCSRAVSW